MPIRPFTRSLSRARVGHALYQGTTSVVPIWLLLFCHPDEAFRPTRDLRFDFFSNLFGRADKAFRSFLIPSEGWAWLCQGTTSVVPIRLPFSHPERASARGVDGKRSRTQSDGRPAPRLPLPKLGRCRVKLVPQVRPSFGLTWVGAGAWKLNRSGQPETVVSEYPAVQREPPPRLASKRWTRTWGTRLRHELSKIFQLRCKGPA